MSRRGMGAALALVVLLAAGNPGSAAAARPDRAACGPGSIEGDLPAAPEGFVAVQTFELTADCQLLSSELAIVPADNLGPADAGASAAYGSISEELAAGGDVSTQGTASGCCYRAYAVQRSWDCCNLLMNEYWMESSWNSCSNGVCGPYIRSYWAQDGGKWKTERSCGSGWSPVSSDHYLYVSSGGLGYTYVKVSGHQGYSYKGVFDCGGTDYYNSYWSSITGYYSGGWACSYSYSWRKSLGFKYQAWCGTGTYGEK